MDLKKLLQTTPESLALEQYNALTEAVIKRLGQVQGHIQRGELDKLSDFLFDSPAGDGHGWDNTCIAFTDLMTAGNEDTDRGTDIGDVVSRLQKLQSIIQRGRD